MPSLQPLPARSGLTCLLICCLGSSFILKSRRSLDFGVEQDFYSVISHAHQQTWAEACSRRPAAMPLFKPWPALSDVSVCLSGVQAPPRNVRSRPLWACGSMTRSNPLQAWPARHNTMAAATPCLAISCLGRQGRALETSAWQVSSTNHGLCCSKAAGLITAGVSVTGLQHTPWESC